MNIPIRGNSNQDTSNAVSSIIDMFYRKKFFNIFSKPCFYIAQVPINMDYCSGWQVNAKNEYSY